MTKQDINNNETASISADLHSMREPKIIDLRRVAYVDLVETLPTLVKALEWHETWENGEWHKSGPYSIYHGREKCHLTYHVGDETETIPCDGGLAEAKATAQKHHVAQIMAALDMTEIQARVEAARVQT